PLRIPGTFSMIFLEVDNDMTAAASEAGSAGQGCLVVLIVSAFSNAPLNLTFNSGILVIKNKVNHPRDSVGTIDSRSPSSHNLHSLKQIGGNGRDIGNAARGSRSQAPS